MIVGLLAMLAMAAIGIAGQPVQDIKPKPLPSYELRKVPVERLLDCTLLGKQIRCRRK